MSTILTNSSDDNKDLIELLVNLLNRLLDENNEIISQFNIQDPNDLGALYENVIGEILNEILSHLPQEKRDVLNLHVATGKILKNTDSRVKSKQIDKMVVNSNEATKFSNIEYYPIENVLVVIECKKTINKDQFDLALENMFSVFDVLEDFLVIEAEKLNDVYSDIDNRQFNIEMTYEYYKPATIIYAFNSTWKNKNTIVKNFYRLLIENSVNKSANRFAKMPDLILADEYLVLKLNGPFYFEYDSVLESIPYFGIVKATKKQQIYILTMILFNKLSKIIDIEIKDIIKEQKPDFQVEFLLNLHLKDQNFEPRIPVKFHDQYDKANKEYESSNRNDNNEDNKADDI